MEYTKGEWKVYTDGMTCATDIVAEDSIGFFTTVVAHMRRQNKDYEANARLIAAAPDMYEALKRLVKETRPYAYQGKAFERLEEAEKALAKVEGK